jgi:hypothetical protein
MLESGTREHAALLSHAGGIFVLYDPPDENSEGRTTVYPESEVKRLLARKRR